MFWVYTSGMSSSIRGNLSGGPSSYEVVVTMEQPSPTGFGWQPVSAEELPYHQPMSFRTEKAALADAQSRVADIQKRFGKKRPAGLTWNRSWWLRDQA